MVALAVNAVPAPHGGKTSDLVLQFGRRINIAAIYHKQCVTYLRYPGDDIYGYWSTAIRRRLWEAGYSSLMSLPRFSIRRDYVGGTTYRAVMEYNFSGQPEVCAHTYGIEESVYHALDKGMRNEWWHPPIYDEDIFITDRPKRYVVAVDPKTN